MTPSTQEIQDRDRAAAFERLRFRADAVVRFISSEPEDLGPKMPHWPLRVARVLILDANEKDSAPPLGYHELERGSALLLDLESLGVETLMVKVLTGTVEVQTSRDCFTMQKGDSVTMTRGLDLGVQFSDRQAHTGAARLADLADEAGRLAPEFWRQACQAAAEVSTYTETIRNLTARLEQAEQTRDAAQREASNQVERRRQAEDALTAEQESRELAKLLVDNLRNDLAAARATRDAWEGQARAADAAHLKTLAELRAVQEERAQACTNLASERLILQRVRENLEAEQMRATGYLTLGDAARAQRDQLQKDLEAERLAHTEDRAALEEAREHTERWRREADQRRRDLEQTANERNKTPPRACVQTSSRAQSRR